MNVLQGFRSPLIGFIHIISAMYPQVIHIFSTLMCQNDMSSRFLKKNTKIIKNGVNTCNTKNYEY